MAEPAANLEPTTRERILAAALDLFARQGFAGTSVRQIARAVSLRESSLYNHFEGKDAIYHALIDSYGPASSAQRLRSPRFQALRDDPRGLCRLYAAELLEQWCDPREQRFNELITTERHRLPAERAHYFETLFSAESGLLTDYFRDFALAGLIRTTNPRETARLFMGGLTFVRLEHFIVPETASPRAVAAETLARFVDNFLELVAPRPKG